MPILSYLGTSSHSVFSGPPSLYKTLILLHMVLTRIDGTEFLVENVLDNADGSAKVAVGDTLGLAAVFGPGLARNPHITGLGIDVIVRDTPVSSSPIGGRTGRIYPATMKAIVISVLRSAIRCDRYQRCSLVVVVRCLQGDGAVLACLTNAAIVALVKAGVELNAHPVAVVFGLGAPTSFPRRPKRRQQCAEEILQQYIDRFGSADRTVAASEVGEHPSTASVTVVRGADAKKRRKHETREPLLSIHAAGRVNGAIISQWLMARPPSGRERGRL
jgi:hypothetical protein